MNLVGSPVLWFTGGTTNLIGEMRNIRLIGCRGTFTRAEPLNSSALPKRSIEHWLVLHFIPLGKYKSPTIDTEVFAGSNPAIEHHREPS